MEFSDKELFSQRERIFTAMSVMCKQIQEMYDTKNTNYLLVMNDIGLVSLCFGNINIGLTNKGEGFGSGYKYEEDDKQHYLIFNILDKSVDKYNKLELLEEFLKVFEVHYGNLIHALVHFDNMEQHKITMEDINNKKSNEEFVNRKYEYNGFLQEILFLAEFEFGLRKDKLIDSSQILAFRDEYIEHIKKERENKDTPVYYFTEDHYKETLKHINVVFDKLLNFVRYQSK